MKKAAIALVLGTGLFAVSACGNDNKPKTEITEQEAVTVDSTIISDQAQADSLEKALRARISQDTQGEESHEGHDHSHEGHSH